jgi:hypothetical protein
MRTTPAAVLVALALSPHHGMAAEPPMAGRVVRLHNGMNTVTLTAARVPALAMLAHRENFNAHSAEVLTLYLQAPALAGETPLWQIVPVLDDHGERLTLATSGGADCVLHDFRLLRPTAGQDATLVLADREPGENYASPAAVQFRYFKLQHNAQGMPGQPLYRFELDHTQPARTSYCDVGEALQSELDIGPQRTER